MKLLRNFLIVCLIFVCIISLGACGKVPSPAQENTGENSAPNNSDSFDGNNTENDGDSNNDSDDPDTDPDTELETGGGDKDDNDNTDFEPTKMIIGIKLADGYYQSLYNIGESYASDIRIIKIYDDETADTDSVNADLSMITGFPTAQTEGAAEITIRLDEHETKVKLYFTDFARKGITPKAEVSTFQNTLSFKELPAEYSLIDTENNNYKYTKKIIITDYKYRIGGIDYNNGESLGVGLYKNVSIYTVCDSKEIMINEPFDLIIGDITETLSFDLTKDFPESDEALYLDAECNTLFYIFINQAYAREGGSVPELESDIWLDISIDKLTTYFSDLQTYDTGDALKANWPSENYESDSVNGRVRQFKEATAKSFKMMLRETSTAETLETYLIAAPEIDGENTENPGFYLIFAFAPGDYMQYCLLIN